MLPSRIFIKSTSMGQQLDDELKMYQRMERGSKSHPGRKAVRSLLDSFDVDGPDDEHRCLVHPPLWESVLTFLHRNPVHRLPQPVLTFVLQRMFLALDYQHTECQIIHTGLCSNFALLCFYRLLTREISSDIKEDNIMFGITDDSVFSDFEEQELQTPCPRKGLDGRIIYVSWELRMPKECGAPVLCDFGSAVFGGIEHSEDIQPNIYRAPEVILEVPWTCSVDIWNVGCMIWDIFEDGFSFTGHDPELQTYRSRAHLAEVISLLGPPPPSLLSQGRLSHKFFSDEGDFCAGIPLQHRIPLEERETALEGQDKASFLRFMRNMLQWEPGKRSSAKELGEDDWIPYAECSVHREDWRSRGDRLSVPRQKKPRQFFFTCARLPKSLSPQRRSLLSCHFLRIVQEYIITNTMNSSSPNTSAGVTQQHHEESPPAPAVNAPDHSTAAPTTSASSPGDEKPTAPVTEAPKEAPLSKATVEDADEDEDSEFDELDDVLDNFSKPAPQPSTTAPASAPAPANEDIDEDAFMRQLEQDMAKMMNHAAQESGAPDNKEFENAINQGADAFTKQLEESGIPPGDFLKQLLADVMAEEGEGAGAAAGASASAGAGAGQSTGGPSESATGAGKAAAPESFNDAIQRTIHRMKESGDKATAAATEDGGISEDMLMQLLKGLEAGVGNGGDDLDLTQMIAGVMEQFSNKEMLYEPMKELDAKWGPWLKDNKGKVPAEDMERYEKQAKLVTEIVAKFEEEGYTDEDPKYRQAVWEKMQEMQALGSPPEELVANPWPEDMAGEAGAALPDCPQQ
ncbi:hypothetical protein IFM58399_10185 [Aspergillus lentulus]|uniref:putative peroxisomal membrane protein receptor Pex19 n=1 Tax=Aspergillus lentulus TaxID=293939 RepID=UPI0013933726|nr:uncharacterized protein IFM58399_10185 [Aspergillus lentulus]KAF4166163.1 hypothetical protein CNMCM6936_007037 [Aspergillus lentulus]GFF55895.1 hypothetical protein IFM58399_10185 [Aspergillus lentulus]